MTRNEVLEMWPILSPAERIEGLGMLTDGEAQDLFQGQDARVQLELLEEMPEAGRRLWVRTLAPDDMADVLQATDDSELRGALIGCLDWPTRVEVLALLAYEEDAAGGLMNPRFARVRPEMTADEAIRYLRRQAAGSAETIYYAYALDAEQRVEGVVSFRELIAAAPQQTVRHIMHAEVIAVRPDTDQEEVARLFAQHDLLAVPVVDAEGRMRGLVTIDDIMDVVREEATEDIQKIGGTASLDAPYLETGVAEMIRKRGGWLAILFCGELLTASALGHHEEFLAQAVVLAAFIPLIISSGGNSGSQATTLVIRAMALGELTLRDAFRVLRREIATGIALGALLGALGFARVGLWENLFGTYGSQWLALGSAVAASLLGVVLFGTVVGALLPLLLRRVGLDPASASAPVVATLVDVTGLMIYFQIARALMS